MRLRLPIPEKPKAFGPVQVLKHGTNQPGRPSMTDGAGWERIDVYTPNDGTGAVRERRFAKGLDDLTPPHSMYPTGYNPDCSLCWLGFSHTEAAHFAGKAVVS